NEVKLQNELTKLAPEFEANTLLSLSVPDEAAKQKWAAKPLPAGYIAPNLEDSYILTPSPPTQGGTEGGSIHPQFVRVVDRTAVELKNFVTGANEAGYHVFGANWGQEFELPERVVDIDKTVAGDRALHDPSQQLKSARGIEVGHIFQLGKKYSMAMGATFTSEQGEELPLVMGCYGVGVSRLAQAAVEQSHDKDGIIWPVAIAPYHAIIVVPNINDTEAMTAAEKLYAALNQAGVETLLDDRDARAGFKFKDADLIGIPYRIVTGRSLKAGKVEFVERATQQSREIPLEDVVTTLKQLTVISK
ncbi:MAG: His/Gly/Thr/Pro-type tRNA ligase C-terminal domain-containing protein, partial [Cyanobacteriota bacterium]|nr:His/Gly/Thr/Pro-type tRNA ligase C-terminal domain-containing protein [Cyanobacteriota bacterium]